MTEPASAAIEARFLRALRRAMLGITLVVTCGSFLQVSAAPGVHQPLWLAVVSLAVLLGVCAGMGAVVLRDRPWGALRLPALALVLAASVAATAAVPAASLAGNGHWSYGVIGWFGVVLLLERPVAVLAGFLFLHSSITVVQLAATGRSDRTSLVGLGTMTVLPFGFQLCGGFAAARLRAAAAVAATTAEMQERVATAEAVAEGVHRDRQERYRELAAAAATLLGGVASGALHPGDPEVRRACAIEAARMRRLFAESDDVAHPLIGELRAGIEQAEQRGVRVELAVRGVLPSPPGDVRRALTGAALALLARAGGAARVAVAGTASSLSVSVVADAPETPVPASQPPDVAVVVLAADGRRWLEATWQVPG